jgi:RNA polymerase sigma factor (sigma-70 family)
LTDQQLLREYAEGRSETAFAELVRRHVDLVYSAARRMVCDSHLAEDVTQAAFVALARSAHQLSDRAVLSGWLHRTAQNIAAQTVRTDVRRRAREEEAAAMNELFAAEPDGVWEHIAHHLDAALGELNEADRDALMLRYFERKSAQEMAQVLGVSDEAAQKRVSRAVERLREFFGKRGVTVGASGLALVLSANAVQAAPAALAVTISAAAGLAGAAVQTATAIAATKTIAMTTLQKSLIAGALALALVAGIGTSIIHHSRGHSAPLMAAAPALPGGADPSLAGSVGGTLRTPEGKPLANAQVFLSTASAAVPVYAAPSPDVVSTVSGGDGRFSFPASPENCAVIVVHDLGYGQATVAELAATAELTLQAWAHVEGTLLQGATPLPNQTIHLSRTRFGSKLQEQAYRTVHDITTKTDFAGHYAFPRVAPGDTWISWRKDPGRYDLQYRYLDLQPGQAITADIGGRGQPVTGRAVLADSDAPVHFYGSVWPKTPHQMRRPPNWRTLPPEEQASLTADWEKTPDAKLYNQERCPIDFRLEADGSFIVPDVPAGDYRITVASWAGAPVKSQMLSRGTTEISVPEMPAGRSDAALDAGKIMAYSTAPLRAGDFAPPFETTTLDGQPLKLADYRGRHVLIHFWRSDAPESLEDMDHFKAAQTARGQDKTFALIGLNFDAALSSAQHYATNHHLTWTQGFLGKSSDVPNRYRLRRPEALLIGPDGRILFPQLTGPGIASALEDALGAK